METGGGKSVQVGICGMSTAEGGTPPVSMPLSIDALQDFFKTFTINVEPADRDLSPLKQLRQDLKHEIDNSWPLLRAHTPICGGMLAMSGFADIAKLGFSERWISVEELKAAGG